MKKLLRITENFQISVGITYWFAYIHSFKLEKNQLPFLVFWKIKVFKANFSNFLLKYRENLKNSSLKPSKFQKKSTSDSGFLKNSKEIGHFWEIFWKIDKKKVKFSELFAKILRWSLENLKNQLTSGVFLSHPVRKINFRFRFKHSSIFRPHFHQLFATITPKTWQI